MEKQVIQSVGFRNIYEDGKAVGFQLKIRLPYYRGVFLSQIKPLEPAVLIVKRGGLGSGIS